MNKHSSPVPNRMASPADLAVCRVWDAARVALMARHIAGLAISSGASGAQIEEATANMTSAFNSLLFAVREFDTNTPLVAETTNDAPIAAAHRLLQS